MNHALLKQLQDVSSADLLDIICVRIAFNGGPDASSFARAAVQDIDEIRKLLQAGEDEWTMDALKRVCEAANKLDGSKHRWEEPLG